MKAAESIENVYTILFRLGEGAIQREGETPGQLSGDVALRPSPVPPRMHRIGGSTGTAAEPAIHPRQCQQAQRQTGSRTFQAPCPLQQVLQLPGQGVRPAMPLFPVPGIPAASMEPSMPLCRPCCNGFRAVSAGLHAPAALGSAVLQLVFQPTEVMESFQWMSRTSRTLPSFASIGYTPVIVKSPRAFSGCGYLYLQPHFSYLLEPVWKILAPRQQRNGRSSTLPSRSATSRTEGSASS